MSQTAETLRALAKEMKPLQDTYEREAAACEAGARAWEIVRRLAAIDLEAQELIDHYEKKK